MADLNRPIITTFPHVWNTPASCSHQEKQVEMPEAPFSHSTYQPEIYPILWNSLQDICKQQKLWIAVFDLDFWVWLKGKLLPIWDQSYHLGCSTLAFCNLDYKPVNLVSWHDWKSGKSGVGCLPVGRVFKIPPMSTSQAACIWNVPIPP